MNTTRKSDIGQNSHKSLDELIRKAIKVGLFVPGQRLVESDLMHQFTASQRHVRDALRFLEGEGLIIIEKNRGAKVRKISHHDVSCILDILHVLSLLAVQKVLEVSGSPDVRIILENSLIKTQEFKNNISKHRTILALLNENSRFWDTLASVVDNPFLWEINNRLETLLSRLKIQGATINSSPELWIDKHDEILIAILHNDKKLAENLVMNSSNNMSKALLSLSQNVFS